MASLMGNPDTTGRFGEFGGRFVPESLMPAVIELESAFSSAWSDPAFRDEYSATLASYAGRPTLLYLAERLSEDLDAQIWLKREDLAHTGSHKINNVIGQALLARRMGKTRLIAETAPKVRRVGQDRNCSGTTTLVIERHLNRIDLSIGHRSANRRTTLDFGDYSKPVFPQ